MTRQPRAFRLDDPNVDGRLRSSSRRSPSMPSRRPTASSCRWAGGAARPGSASSSRPCRVCSCSGLGLAVENLIVDLYAVAPWLGWVALALAVLALVGLSRHRRPGVLGHLAGAEDRAPARGRQSMRSRSRTTRPPRRIVADLLELSTARGRRSRAGERPPDGASPTRSSTPTTASPSPSGSFWRRSMRRRSAPSRARRSRSPSSRR